MPTSSNPESWHPFTAQERILLVCVATGIDPAAAGVVPHHAMQVMEIRGLIERDGDGSYNLADAGRRAFVGLLARAGIHAQIRQETP
jgi:hypothetical protein